MEVPGSSTWDSGSSSRPGCCVTPGSPQPHPALAPACQVAGRALAPAGPGTRLTWARCPLHSQCKSKASATAAIHKRAITTSLPHKSTAGKIEFEVESIQRQKVGIFMSKFGVFLINN